MTVDPAKLREMADAAEARANKATPGPWVSQEERIGVINKSRKYGPHAGKETMTVLATAYGLVNGPFIAAARTDVPALAAQLRAAADEIERLRAREPRCGMRPPVPWFTACIQPYGHRGLCNFAPLQSLYASDKSCETCGNDRAAWDALREAHDATLAQAALLSKEVEMRTQERDEAMALLHDVVPAGDMERFTLDLSASGGGWVRLAQFARDWIQRRIDAALRGAS